MTKAFDRSIKVTLIWFPLSKCFFEISIFFLGENIENYHCVKSVRIRRYSGPHFSRIFPHSDWILGRYPPVFSPSAGKTRTRITSNTDTFYPVYNLPIKPQIESDVFDVMKFLICLSRIIAVSIYAQKSPLLVTLLDGKGKIYFLTFPEFCKPENSITLEVS